MLDDVEVLVFRHIRCVLSKLGCTRIERIGEHPMRAMDVAMTTRAIHLIYLHAGDQIVVCWMDWILRFWGSPIDSCVRVMLAR